MFLVLVESEHSTISYFYHNTFHLHCNIWYSRAFAVKALFTMFRSRHHLYNQIRHRSYTSKSCLIWVCSVPKGKWMKGLTWQNNTNTAHKAGIISFTLLILHADLFHFPPLFWLTLTRFFPTLTISLLVLHSGYSSFSSPVFVWSFVSIADLQSESCDTCNVWEKYNTCILLLSYYFKPFSTYNP